jgi:hypothetical protein
MKIEVNHKEQSMESRFAGSLDVHDFYERMPYPAPLTSLDEHRDPIQVAFNENMD